MSVEPAVEARESRPARDDLPAPLTNAQLTQELILLKRQNTELGNHVQNMLARLSKLDRDVRAVASQRR